MAALVCLVGCGQSAPSAPSDGRQTNSSSPSLISESRPFSVVSPSGIQMAYLPGGEFVMGSDHGNPDEAPRHRVRVSGFLMDAFEVTHEMFVAAQLPNPSHWQDQPRKPVERVRWQDAKQYCNERSRLEGLTLCYDEKTARWKCNYAADGYRLPTEAEWEYACRAGTDDPYEFGMPDKLRQYAWFADNAGEKTHVVGQKKPNRWGIYDLCGNVSEWCEDVYSPGYYAESPPVDPTGPPSPDQDVKRVMRGGNWKSSVDMCRSSFRQGQRTGDTDACFYTDYCGFRCVRRVSPEALAQWTRATP